MRILLTAFNAFGDLPANPSQVLVERYASLQTPPSGAELFWRILDTSYAAANQQIVQLIDAVRPDVLLMFGVAQGSSSLRIETRAINRDHANIPDNSGELRIERVIDLQGAPSFSSTIPVDALLQLLRGAGIPAYLSHDAGTFVCNHTLYAALRHINESQLSTRCGFIHVPLPAEMCPDGRGDSVLTFDDMVQAVDTCVRFLGTNGTVT